MSPGTYRVFALVLYGCLLGVHSATVEESLRRVSSSQTYVEIKGDSNLAIDLKYASVDNFMAFNLYGDFNKAYLHRIAAEKLALAAKKLAAVHPKWKLAVYDALRPRSVQYLLWDKVKGTDKEPYVANPKGGSIHNFGFAVDLTLLDESGIPLDMGTAFDDFSSLAQPRLEAGFLKAGKLSRDQVDNRVLLRGIMESAGFIPLPLEWWHFDALPKAEVKSKYKIVE
jgi:zinc D-Ala-D-Ala dipeptidase